MRLHGFLADIFQTFVVAPHPCSVLVDGAKFGDIRFDSSSMLVDVVRATFLFPGRLQRKVHPRDPRLEFVDLLVVREDRILGDVDPTPS